MVDFDKFDDQIDVAEVNKKVKEAKDSGSFDDVPKGLYTCSVEKMELGATKKDGRPMFTLACRIKEGKMKKRMLFMNRVVFGTKNDANMIQSVLSILEKFVPDESLTFKGYAKLNDTILDIFEDIQGKVEVDVDWDPDAFNSISIKEVYDI